MTVNELLNKARENAKKVTYEYYLDICDGDVQETKDWIEHEKENGSYQADLKRFTMDNIYKLIRTIKKTKLMNDKEKENAINEIKSCVEYQETEKDVAMIFANHFYKYSDVYLK